MSSSQSEILHGVLPVLQTPFTNDGAIDRSTLDREIDWAFETGADGVVVAMVSETLRLGYRGRVELAELVCQAVQGRGFTVISVGAESTKEAIEFATHAADHGASALMAIPPISSSIGNAAVSDYFGSIANAVSIPLVVQDASNYVGKAIDQQVYVDLLAQFGPERILFKPEASPLGPNLSALRDLTCGKARIFEGSGGVNLVDCYRRGIVGTMPGTDLLDGIVALWKALKAGDDERAYQIFFPLCAIVSFQIQAGLDGFLAIEKYLLWKRGIFPNRLQRQPVAWELDLETQAEVDRLFARLQAIL